MLLNLITVNDGLHSCLLSHILLSHSPTWIYHVSSVLTCLSYCPSIAIPWPNSFCHPWKLLTKLKKTAVKQPLYQQLCVYLSVGFLFMFNYTNAYYVKLLRLLLNCFAVLYITCLASCHSLQ